MINSRPELTEFVLAVNTYNIPRYRYFVDLTESSDGSLVAGCTRNKIIIFRVSTGKCIYSVDSFACSISFLSNQIITGRDVLVENVPRVPKHRKN